MQAAALAAPHVLTTCRKPPKCGRLNDYEPSTTFILRTSFDSGRSGAGAVLAENRDVFSKAGHLAKEAACRTWNGRRQASRGNRLRASQRQQLGLRQRSNPYFRRRAWPVAQAA